MNPLVALIAVFAATCFTSLVLLLLSMRFPQASRDLSAEHSKAIKSASNVSGWAASGLLLSSLAVFIDADIGFLMLLLCGGASIYASIRIHLVVRAHCHG